MVHNCIRAGNATLNTLHAKCFFFLFLSAQCLLSWCNFPDRKCLELLQTSDLARAFQVASRSAGERSWPSGHNESSLTKTSTPVFSGWSWLLPGTIPLRIKSAKRQFTCHTSSYVLHLQLPAAHQVTCYTSSYLLHLSYLLHIKLSTTASYLLHIKLNKRRFGSKKHAL